METPTEISVALAERAVRGASAARAFALRFKHVLFFAAGFLFDLVALNRIDSRLDIAFHAFDLFSVTALIVAQEAHRLGRLSLPERLERHWDYSVEALHFFYGCLLNAYIIFYAKSTTGLRSGTFLVLVAGLMAANEMPQVKKAGARLRLGLHAFCLASFLNYVIPVFVGRMGASLFILALVLTALASAGLIFLLLRLSAEPPREGLRLGWPVAAVLGLMGFFYFMRWIPPVPLSMQYIGIYHNVERADDEFVLTYRKPRWYRFWRKDDRPFLARSGERIHCFVRIFAPTRFTHQVVLHWQRLDPATGRWASSDRVPLDVRGGRDLGWRGFGIKSHFSPGSWLVAAETSDGRVIGEISFDVASDDSGLAPIWRQGSM